MELILPKNAELCTRVLAMPKDANPHGDIFGGWVLSQMDVAGAVFANDLIKERVVTVHVEEMTFHGPVYIGDLLSCYCRMQKVGNTSITIYIEAFVQRDFKIIRVTEGSFVYVCIDENRRPKKIQIKEE